MRTLAVATLKSDYNLAVLLEIARLPRSTFYYHLHALNRPDRHAAVKALITEIFSSRQGRYGHRRIRLELHRRGMQISQKTVWKLMRELGLKCKTRSRKRYVSYRGQVGTIADNVLNRDFTATEPNQKWVTDVTEFRIGADKLYLSPIMDLFDRSVLSYSIGPSPTVEFTLTPLKAALSALPPGATVLVHSDQGFQYQHGAWRAALANAGARQSMSRKGNCLDNAVMENFFGHVKEEMFHHDPHDDIAALESALHTYIAWYNTQRLSLTLKGMSPIEYRTHALAA
ncbi:IS3 family transposase [Flaviflexus salsibiostraticola]|uniref:IS3 family transposase n=1 Tax=Flaviflexus salsibiostraticola TaxID=1282737 RepID=UPI0013DE4CD1|nr:IS3 family transposase [Flaviflexus salsibiostraticola]